MAAVEICRKYGISDQTYYNWKAKYGGMSVSESKKLRQLEDENRRLKHLVADLTLDNQALKAVGPTPATINEAGKGYSLSWDCFLA